MNALIAFGDLLQRGQPAVGGPGPVHDDRVHEGGHEERIAQVPYLRRALRHGAGNDRGCGGGEGPLEEPHGPGVVRRDGAGSSKVVRLVRGVAESKVPVPDEAVCR